jgi:hypothetical protein
MKQKWTYFPALNASQSIAFEIDLGAELRATAVCSATLIYTNQQGHRMVRVLTWSVVPTRDIQEVLHGVDPIAVTAMTVKNGCRVVLSSGPSNGLVCFREYLLDIFQLFPLGLSRRLLPYAHFCYAFRMSIVFNTQPDVDVDARRACLLNAKGMNCIDILLWTHPRLIPISDPETTVPLVVESLTAYPVLIAHLFDRIFVCVASTADQGEVEQLFGLAIGQEVPELANDRNVALRSVIGRCWALSGRFLPVRVIRPEERLPALLLRYFLEFPDAYENWYSGMYAALAQRK